MPLIQQTPRRLRAAARLAALYAAGVGILLLALLLSVDGGRLAVRDLVAIAIPIGVSFGAAFLLLASARRLGFTALWVVSLGLWAWMSFDQPHGPRPGIAFLLWSVFSLPLALMTWLGFAAPTDSDTRVHAVAVGALVLVWGGLLIASVVREYNYDPLLAAGWWVTPIALSLGGVYLVHRHRNSQSAAT